MGDRQKVRRQRLGDSQKVRRQTEDEGTKKG